MGHGRANAYAAVLAAQALTAREFGATNAQELQILNPAKNNYLQVISNGKHIGKYEMVINSIDGKLVQSVTIDINAGINEIGFRHPAGSYIVTLKGKDYSKIFKVLTQ